jgi:hypothetical protein
MKKLQRLSHLLLTALTRQVGVRLSGYFVIDAYWMRFNLVIACSFRRCPACGFSLAAYFRTSLSLVNRLIRPEGLSPSWTPTSSAHTRTPKLEPKMRFK